VGMSPPPTMSHHGLKVIPLYAHGDSPEIMEGGQWGRALYTGDHQCLSPLAPGDRHEPHAICCSATGITASDRQAHPGTKPKRRALQTVFRDAIGLLQQVVCMSRTSACQAPVVWREIAGNPQTCPGRYTGKSRTMAPPIEFDKMGRRYRSRTDRTGLHLSLASDKSRS
jgi:hypothetical protein